MNFRKRFLFYFVIMLLFVMMFTWGFITNINRIFPYALLHFFRASERIGIQSRSVNPLGNLKSLPYIKGTYDSNFKKTGVIFYDQENTIDGYNFYNSIEKNTAYLINMKGRVIHQWSYPSDPWHHAELFPNGDVIALIKDKRLIKIDKNSKLIWSFSDRFHHDFWIDNNQDIYALKSKAEVVSEIHKKVRTLVDYFIILSRNGIKKEEVSLLKIILNSPYSYILPSIHDLKFDVKDELDILHTNHIEVFNGNLRKKSIIFKKGNILISIRNINTNMIIDKNKKEIIWMWGPTNLTFHHHATLLNTGNILLFNNGLERSEIIEVDPLSYQIKWRYTHKGFFSKSRGTNQRLDNGNTLITESDTGYVFEVTPDHKIVWEFANPEINEEGIRMAIWKMKRFKVNELTFLNKKSVK